MTIGKGCAILPACVLGFLALYEYYPSTYFDLFGDGCQTLAPEEIGASYGFVQGLLVGVALLFILSWSSSRKQGEMTQGQSASAEGTPAPYASLPDWFGRTAPFIPNDCQTDRTAASPCASDKVLPSQDAIQKTLTSD
jgi:hypothetical protein